MKEGKRRSRQGPFSHWILVAVTGIGEQLNNQHQGFMLVLAFLTRDGEKQTRALGKPLTCTV